MKHASACAGGPLRREACLDSGGGSITVQTAITHASPGSLGKRRRERPKQKNWAYMLAFGHMLIRAYASGLVQRASGKSSSRKPKVPKVASYRITSHPGEYRGRF